MRRLKRAHVLVRGLVQGVFFRAHTQEVAERFNLTGWVRNTPDGAVEIVAEGDQGSLEKFVDWCKMGPRSAHVTKVDLKYSDALGEFDSFRIKYF